MTCLKRVGDGTITYSCELEGNHAGPCVARELKRSTVARNEWSRNQTSPLPEPSVLDQFQGPAQTTAQRYTQNPAPLPGPRVSAYVDETQDVWVDDRAVVVDGNPMTRDLAIGVSVKGESSERCTSDEDIDPDAPGDWTLRSSAPYFGASRFMYERLKAGDTWPIVSTMLDTSAEPLLEQIFQKNPLATTVTVSKDSRNVTISVQIDFTCDVLDV